MPQDYKISNLTESFLGLSDFIPISRSSSNYKLNLRKAITGAFSDQKGNTRIGHSALTDTGPPQWNVCIGDNAGKITEGNENVIIGFDAGSSLTNGGSNVIIGDQAALELTSISSAVIIGEEAGRTPPAGDNCVILGAGASVGDDNNTNSIVIGQSAVGAGSNTTVIGNSSTTGTILKGRVAATAPNDQSAFYGEASNASSHAILGKSTLGNNYPLGLKNNSNFTCSVGFIGATNRTVLFPDQDGDVILNSGDPLPLPRIAKATLSSYTPSNWSGYMVYVPDETGGAVMAFSDGANWRRVTDRAVVS